MHPVVSLVAQTSLTCMTRRKPDLFLVPASATTFILIQARVGRHDVAESYSLLLHCCPRIYLSRNGLLLVLALFAEDAGTADLRYVPSAAHFSPSCR